MESIYVEFYKKLLYFFVLLMIVGVAIVYTGWSYHDNQVFIRGT